MYLLPFNYYLKVLDFNSISLHLDLKQWLFDFCRVFWLPLDGQPIHQRNIKLNLERCHHRTKKKSEFLFDMLTDPTKGNNSIHHLQSLLYHTIVVVWKQIEKHDINFIGWSIFSPMERKTNVIHVLTSILGHMQLSEYNVLFFLDGKL